MSRRVYAVRCSTETPPALQEIASLYSCIYIGKDGKPEPSVGQLLDRIAEGQLRIVPPDPV